MCGAQIEAVTKRYLVTLLQYTTAVCRLRTLSAPVKALDINRNDLLVAQLTGLESCSYPGK